MKLAGLVLAGGRSSRMGRDKSELVIDGQTLLERAIALLESAGASLVYVAGRTDVPYGLPDREQYAGPAVAAIDACKTMLADGFTHALVIPVDMPLLNVDALKTFIKTEGAAVSYATEPLPFFLELEAACALKAEPFSLKRFLSDIGGAEIPKPENDLIFVNANTPEEWDLICQELGSD